ncbi:MAG: rhomboid family intramembrane serine protease [Bacteroidota bacterium]|nr:rhomboid family intramembrane serine protease [Bacteroidota bacterium]
MSIIDEIKQSFKKGNNLIKLIYINLAVFLAVKIITIIYFLFALENSSFSLINILALPADTQSLMFKPWTIFTYMFLHEGFLHILFNMLWLFWFGQIFLRFLSEKKLLSLYIVGGLAGGLLYILSYNIFPVFNPTNSIALGASASVMAIVIATAVYSPDYTINLMFIGPVKLKYIAIASIVLDIISIPTTNSGGHIAHLGGALFGFLYISQYRKGRDITKGFDKFMDKLFSLFKPKPKFKVTHKRSMNDFEYNKTKAGEQKEIDKILEKIANKGYNSLTKKEKEILFKMSNKK